jgi:hypothetical protein
LSGLLSRSSLKRHNIANVRRLELRILTGMEEPLASVAENKTITAPGDTPNPVTHNSSFTHFDSLSELHAADGGRGRADDLFAAMNPKEGCKAKPDYWDSLPTLRPKPHFQFAK